MGIAEFTNPDLHNGSLAAFIVQMTGDRSQFLKNIELENTEVIFFRQFLNRYLFLVFYFSPKYITISGGSFKSFVCVTCRIYKYIALMTFQ